MSNFRASQVSSARWRTRTYGVAATFGTLIGCSSGNTEPYQIALDSGITTDPGGASGEGTGGAWVAPANSGGQTTLPTTGGAPSNGGARQSAGGAAPGAGGSIWPSSGGQSTGAGGFSSGSGGASNAGGASTGAGGACAIPLFCPPPAAGGAPSAGGSSGVGGRDPNGPCKDLMLPCFDIFDMWIFNPELCKTCNAGKGCQTCIIPFAQ